MKPYIKGTYRKSIFTSPQGFVIGLFKVRDTNDEEMENYLNKTITFTGYFPELKEDDSYLFYGEPFEHPRYGFQYQVDSFEHVKPEDKDGIIEFLSSDLFPGIGEKQASKIVELLGPNTLDIILQHPEQLNLVPKLSKKKAEQIIKTLNQYEESHKVIVYLTDLGFGMRDALSIYNLYKKDTISKIEHNIYEMVEEVEELTFKKVDPIGLHFGIEKDDERRIKACILYSMMELCFQNGDVYLYPNEIKEKTAFNLHLDAEEIDFSSCLEELVIEDKIYVEDDKYYLIQFYQAEMNIANKVKTLLKKTPMKYKKLDAQIDALEKEQGILYNEKQREAIKKSLEQNILIITGGPGTGKTTIIKAIVELYQSLNHLNYDGLVSEIALLAPTGRASKRMSEATNYPASTIHRFLKWNKDSNEFRVNEDNKDHSRFIIVDEVSMIDLELFDSLLKGLTNQIQLILVGDFHQLPSVGPGQILKDMIESDVIDTIHLDFLYRQDENSYITTLAQEIKNNDLSESYLKTKSDYRFFSCQASSIKKNLKHLCEQVKEKGYDYKRMQVMAPMYRGENGIDALNKELQDVFNPKSEEKQELALGEVIFREQDKILQLVNMPDDNVFNGDIGYISNIIPANKSDSKKAEIYVNYDGNVVKYLPKDFSKIRHGFVITIHKSQGSEFELVIIPICKSYYRMLYRKLIYTGITRAKKKLILIGEPEAFLYSVQNEQEIKRKTSLKEKLEL